MALETERLQSRAGQFEFDSKPAGEGPDHAWSDASPAAPTARHTPGQRAPGQRSLSQPPLNKSPLNKCPPGPLQPAGFSGGLTRISHLVRDRLSLTAVRGFPGDWSTIRQQPLVDRVLGLLTRFWERFKETRLYRLVTATLARRIFVANLLGLLVLICGMLWLSQHQAWLITAKRESLKVQGEIIAATIAANASVDTDRLTFEPDRLPEVEGRKAPYRDDGFATFELSLRPDRVGPVIRRLIQPTHNTRARIYDRDGEMIADSDRGAGRPQLPISAEVERVRVKTPWTRFMAWIDSSDLPVYREIGNANGNNYTEVRQALRGSGPPPMLLINDDGKQIVSLAVPIQRKNLTLGAVLLSTKPGDIEKILANERWIILYLALMALAATVMTSMLLDHTIASPVRRLSAAAEEVSQHIGARATLPDYADRRDEVGQMADAFTRMTAALFKRIEASEKFAADVAHELKNPVAAARATAETMYYAKTAEQRDQLVTQIQGELKRLNRLITDVSNASRLDAELARQKNQPVDLRTTISNVVHVLNDLHASDNIAVRFDSEATDADGEGLVVMGHEGRLGQVITNLLDNAISFSKPGQCVRVRTQRFGNEIEFAVEDEGPGMPDDKLEAVFDRFYSDRPESDRLRGKNSGLGLSISREIIAAHDGRIWAENRRAAADDSLPVLGARFVVRLPAEAAAIVRGQVGHGWRQQP